MINGNSLIQNVQLSPYNKPVIRSKVYKLRTYSQDRRDLRQFDIAENLAKEIRLPDRVCINTETNMMLSIVDNCR